MRCTDIAGWTVKHILSLHYYSSSEQEDSCHSHDGCMIDDQTMEWHDSGCANWLTIAGRFQNENILTISLGDWFISKPAISPNSERRIFLCKIEGRWQRTNKPKSNSTRLSVKCWKKIIFDSRLHNNTFIHSKIIHHCERFTFSVTLLPLPVDSVSDLHVESHSWVCNVYLDCRLINIVPWGTRLVAAQLQSISWTS